MEWYWVILITGVLLSIGAMIGVVIMALCVISKKSNPCSGCPIYEIDGSDYSYCFDCKKVKR